MHGRECAWDSSNVNPIFMKKGWSAHANFGPATRKLVRTKSGPGGPLLAAKIGPTPDHFWLPKMVRLPKVVRVY